MPPMFRGHLFVGWAWNRFWFCVSWPVYRKHCWDSLGVSSGWLWTWLSKLFPVGRLPDSQESHSAWNLLEKLSLSLSLSLSPSLSLSLSVPPFLCSLSLPIVLLPVSVCPTSVSLCRFLTVSMCLSLSLSLSFSLLISLSFPFLPLSLSFQIMANCSRCGIGVFTLVYRVAFFGTFQEFAR